MPSGKTLWLCEEHQHKSRVTVLEEDDWELPEHPEEPSVLEYKLLTKLKEIADGVEEKAVAEETGKLSLFAMYLNMIDLHPDYSCS